MNSKVVLTLDDEGKAAVEQRIRGRKQSLDYLVDQLKKYAMDLNRYPVYISHGDCREEAEYVAARIKEETEAKEVLIRVLGSGAGSPLRTWYDRTVLLWSS